MSNAEVLAGEVMGGTKYMCQGRWHLQRVVFRDAMLSANKTEQPSPPYLTVIYDIDDPGLC